MTTNLLVQPACFSWLLQVMLVLLMKNVCELLKHELYRLDAIPDIQPTASKHWTQQLTLLMVAEVLVSCSNWAELSKTLSVNLFWLRKHCSRSCERSESRWRVSVFARGRMLALSTSRFIILDPAARHCTCIQTFATNIDMVIRPQLVPNSFTATPLCK